MRRLVSLGSIAAALVVLGLVLYNATLVDRRPPSVTGVSLSATVGGDDRLAQTVTAIDIAFSEPVDRASAEARIQIEPAIPGAFTWDGARAIFTPSEPLPLDVAFEVRVEAGFRDLAGNVAPTGIDAWAFRSVGPPWVVAVEPGDGATDLPVDARIVVTFDRLMDTGSVERSIRLDPPVALAPTWSGETLTLAGGPLRFGTTYSLTIGGQAADTGGNRLGLPFVTRFATVAAGLGVQAVIPVDGVSGIGVATPIAVVFDAAIEPASAATALSISPSVPGAVSVLPLPADIDPDAGGPPDPDRLRVLVYTPVGALAPHTTYRVELAPVVTRLGAPGQVAPGRTWSFTTGAPTTSALNQVAFLSARAGVGGVWLMNPDGTNARQLTTTLGPVSGYDVSPDGSLVAFAAAGGVSVMAVDGGGLTDLTQSGYVEAAPTFTPDGRSIVVGRRDASGADLGYWEVPLPGVLPSIDPGRRLLATGAPPLGSTTLIDGGGAAGPGTSSWAARAAFHPDGRWMLIATGAGDVHLIDRGPGFGEEPVATAVGLVADAAPVWVEARGGFAIVAREPASQEIAAWLVKTDGSRARLASAVGSIAAAADGTLAFAEVEPRTGTTRIAVLRPDGQRVAVTDAQPETEDRWPGFAPDGGSLLFGRVSATGRSIADGIWTVRLADRVAMRLAPDGTFPAWLP